MGLLRNLWRIGNMDVADFRKQKKMEELAEQQENDLRNEVIRRAYEIGFSSDITIKSLELELYIIEKDLEKWTSIRRAHPNDAAALDGTIQMLQGLESIYKRAIQEGLDKWLDHDFLENKYKNITTAVTIHMLAKDNTANYKLYAGQQMAIAGLQKGELYYTWTDPELPISVNKKFLEAMKERGLLDERFFKVTDGKPSRW